MPVLKTVKRVKPATLISYIYFRRLLESKHKRGYRSWVLDSGAYTALNTGKSIDLNAYIDACLSLQQGPEQPKHIFALDVIGDPEASLRNAETMWQQGVEAIPTFHHGSNFTYLEHLVRNYAKIAIGGLVARAEGVGLKLTYTARRKFLDQCFARAWPKWIHGFGCTDSRLLLNLPFASVDSVTWCYQTRRFGKIVGYCYGEKQLKAPRGSKDIRGQDAAVRMALAASLRLEQEVRSKLGRILLKATSEPFDLCLGVIGPELAYFHPEGIVL